MYYPTTLDMIIIVFNVLLSITAAGGKLNPMIKVVPKLKKGEKQPAEAVLPKLCKVMSSIIVYVDEVLKKVGGIFCLDIVSHSQRNQLKQK